MIILSTKPFFNFNPGRKDWLVSQNALSIIQNRDVLRESFEQINRYKGDTLAITNCKP
jgi:hypothetical protein